MSLSSHLKVYCEHHGIVSEMRTVESVVTLLSPTGHGNSGRKPWEKCHKMRTDVNIILTKHVPGRSAFKFLTSSLQLLVEFTKVLLLLDDEFDLHVSKFYIYQIHTLSVRYQTSTLARYIVLPPTILIIIVFIFKLTLA